MDLLRPRYLRFEDVSGTIKLDIQQPGADLQCAPESATQADVTATMGDLELQLSTLACKIQGAHDAMDARIEKHKKAALELLEATGGRQSLESHLKAQKASWKFIGQKEAFLDRLKELSSCKELLQHDFSADTAKADTAVKALKEDIRERHAAISKEELELQDLIAQLTRVYSKGKSTARGLGSQLPVIVEELQDRKAKLQQLPEPLVDGMTEAELLRLVEQEEQRAAQLEQTAARAAANRAAEASKRAMLENKRSVLQAAVVAAEEECSAAAEQAGASYREKYQRYEMLATLLTRVTGAEIRGSGESSLQLHLTQTIPRGVTAATSASAAALPASTGASNSQPTHADSQVQAAGVAELEHSLTLVFAAPGSAALRSALLNPPDLDLNPFVEEAQKAQKLSAKDTAEALARLVLGVKLHLRRHWRRELQLDEANAEYPLQPTSVSPEVLRCVLSNQIEAEVQVPMSWPEHPVPQLQLLRLEAPRASQGLGPLLARLQRELKEASVTDGSAGGGVQAELRRRWLRGCSLREFLGWVYSNVKSELGP